MNYQVAEKVSAVREKAEGRREKGKREHSNISPFSLFPSPLTRDFFISLLA